MYYSLSYIIICYDFFYLLRFVTGVPFFLVNTKFHLSLIIRFILINVRSFFLHSLRTAKCQRVAVLVLCLFCFFFLFINKKSRAPNSLIQLFVLMWKIYREIISFRWKLTAFLNYPLCCYIWIQYDLSKW